MGRRRGVTMRLRDGSGTFKLKYLSEEKDRHGNMRMYFRRAGKRVRLHEVVGTPEFIDEYKAALSGAPKDHKKPEVPKALRGSLLWLAEQYFQSAEFKQLDPRTQYVRRGIVARICERNGDKPFERMETRHVRKIRDEKAEYPNAANSRVKTLRQIFKWANEVELSANNPAASVSYLATKPDGYYTWSVEDVRKFEEFYAIGTKERLIMSIMLYLGVRRSDAIRLGPQMESSDGTKIRFSEFKGRNQQVKERELTILPELRKVLDGTEIGHLAYLTTRGGKTYSAAGFGNWFRDACNRAGLPRCRAHGLRKAGATIAADNGATEYELMAIFGWSSPKQAGVYTRKANRTKIADRAMRYLVPEQNEVKTVALSDKAATGATLNRKKPTVSKRRS